MVHDGEAEHARILQRTAASLRDSECNARSSVSAPRCPPCASSRSARVSSPAMSFGDRAPLAKTFTQAFRLRSFQNPSDHARTIHRPVKYSAYRRTLVKPPGRRRIAHPLAIVSFADCPGSAEVNVKVDQTRRDDQAGAVNLFDCGLPIADLPIGLRCDRSTMRRSAILSRFVRGGR